MKQRNDRYIIDRLEGDIAVCETADGGHVDIPKSELPETVREGDVIIKCCGGYSVSEKETDARRRRMIRLKDLLMKE